MCGGTGSGEGKASGEVEKKKIMTIKMDLLASWGTGTLQGRSVREEGKARRFFGSTTYVRHGQVCMWHAAQVAQYSVCPVMDHGYSQQTLSFSANARIGG